jgi:hypothetical protein
MQRLVIAGSRCGLSHGHFVFLQIAADATRLTGPIVLFWRAALDLLLWHPAAGRTKGSTADHVR